MKLGDMNTVQMGKAICQIAPAIAHIVEDEEFAQLMIPAKEGERRTLAGMLAVMAPAMLDRHLDDTLAILSVLTEKSIPTLRKQKGMQTIRDIMECLDRDLIDFFTSSAGGAVKKSAQ